MFGIPPLTFLIILIVCVFAAFLITHVVMIPIKRKREDLRYRRWRNQLT